jgi:hypothetical protein
MALDNSQSKIGMKIKSAVVILRQIYEIRFSKFGAVFCENEILGLYSGPKVTILYTQENFCLELGQYGYQNIHLL